MDATSSPPPAPPAAVVAERAEAIRRRIAEAGRDPAEVRVVAVTKGFGIDAVRAALGAGLEHIGENYAAELVAKADALAGGDEAGAPVRAAWHYLGAVQRRRVRDLAPVVAWWETVSRAVEGEAIAGRAPGATVLVEVETTGAVGRNGAPPAAVPALVERLRDLGLDVRGLMTVGPAGDAEAARAAFRTTARLAAKLGLAELSMGMTDDLEVAVAEGSTMVRVGRALFGERPARGA
jgi:pyridoxal phosphate enzyme (YggS family)